MKNVEHHAEEEEEEKMFPKDTQTDEHRETRAIRVKNWRQLKETEAGQLEERAATYPTDLNQTHWEAAMNDDILTGQWKQMKGSLKSWWGQLTDDDFDDIGGQKDKLIGWVQENYGRTHEQAAQEVDARLKEYSDKYDGTFGDLESQGLRYQ